MKTALSGLQAWLFQRFTALYMLAFWLFVLAHFVLDPPRSYAAWHDWATALPVAIAGVLFFLALLLHAWVGLRDVMLDYVRPPALRLGMLALLCLVLGALALWSMRILLLAQP